MPQTAVGEKRADNKRCQAQSKAFRIHVQGVDGVSFRDDFRSLPRNMILKGTPLKPNASLKLFTR